MSVTYTILGIKETRKFIADGNIKLNKSISNGLSDAGKYLKGEIEASIKGNRAEKRSVDSGKFLNSVEVHTENKLAIMSSNTEYSKHLEYGTSKIKARRHFSNSADRSQKKMRDIIGIEIIKK